MPLVTENKAKAEAEAMVNAEPIAQDGLGAKSGAIEFIAPLGDPSKPDITIDPKTKEKTTTHFIVGYRFKALEDLVVPECGLGDDARKNLMSFADKNGTKAVKAGDEFDLTRFETGLLLAPAEYNGRISGGGKCFTVVYGSLKSRDNIVTTDEIPTVSLRAESGSIKDYNFIDVLTADPETNNEGKVIRKHRTIVPGFEKWAPLCKETIRAPKVGGGATSPKATRNKAAEAFLNIVAKK